MGFWLYAGAVADFVVGCADKFKLWCQALLVPSSRFEDVIEILVYAEAVADFEQFTLYRGSSSSCEDSVVSEDLTSFLKACFVVLEDKLYFEDGVLKPEELRTSTINYIVTWGTCIAL